MGTRQDLAQYRQAISNRWEISPEMREKAVSAMLDGLNSDKPREQAAAAKVLIAMERQNQEDQRTEGAELLAKLIQLTSELSDRPAEDASPEPPRID